MGAPPSLSANDGSVSSDLYALETSSSGGSGPSAATSAAASSALNPREEEEEEGEDTPEGFDDVPMPSGAVMGECPTCPTSCPPKRPPPRIAATPSITIRSVGGNTAAPNVLRTNSSRAFSSVLAS
eukprot:29051-Pelagococcus_subviridis.AAC.4